MQPWWRRGWEGQAWEDDDWQRQQWQAWQDDTAESEAGMTAQSSDFTGPHGPWEDRRPHWQRRGKHQGGSPFGWGPEAEERELAPWEVSRVVVYSNLSHIPQDFWDRTKEVAGTRGCVYSHRKDRHNENFKVIPYRLTVRGEESDEVLGMILDNLVACYSEVVAPEDVFAFPSPDMREFAEFTQTLQGWRAVWNAAGPHLNDPYYVRLRMPDVETRRVRITSHGGTQPWQKRLKKGQAMAEAAMLILALVVVVHGCGVRSS